jgi:type IV secretory pathway TrbD component
MVVLKMNTKAKRGIFILVSGFLAAAGCVLTPELGSLGMLFFGLGLWLNGFISAAIIAKDRAEIGNVVNRELVKRGIPGQLKGDVP